ncbi:MAG: hypothetical protein RR242_09925 [Clostridium sp.]
MKIIKESKCCLLVLCLVCLPLLSAFTNASTHINYYPIAFWVNGEQAVLQDSHGGQYEPLSYRNSIFIPITIAGEWMGKDVQVNEVTGDIIFSGSMAPQICGMSEQRPATKDEILAHNSCRKYGISIAESEANVFIDEDDWELYAVDGTLLKPLIYKNSYYLPVRSISKQLGMDIVCAIHDGRYTVYLQTPFSQKEGKDIFNYINTGFSYCNKLNSSLTDMWKSYDTNSENEVIQALSRINTITNEIYNLPVPLTDFGAIHYNNIKNISHALHGYIENEIVSVNNNHLAYTDSYYFSVKSSVDMIFGSLSSLKNAYEQEGFSDVSLGE